MTVVIFVTIILSSVLTVSMSVPLVSSNIKIPRSLIQRAVLVDPPMMPSVAQHATVLVTTRFSRQEKSTHQSAQNNHPKPLVPEAAAKLVPINTDTIIFTYPPHQSPPLRDVHLKEKIDWMQYFQSAVLIFFSIVLIFHIIISPSRVEVIDLLRNIDRKLDLPLSINQPYSPAIIHRPLDMTGCVDI